MEREMFYKAGPLIFDRARKLRNSMTDAELVLWGYLKTKPMGNKFRRQHPLGIYIADFFCYKQKLVIEVDGGIHKDETVKTSDLERQKIIEGEGITVFRFSNEEVLKQLETVIIKIETYLKNKIPEAGRSITPL
ncbi:MAG TPA: endonuclease domain-containing protein [Chitinophagaceae bacterium]|nr:endonuclease domain-containing protein [Chitinophagaceae bacterium]